MGLTPMLRPPDFRRTIHHHGMARTRLTYEGPPVEPLNPCFHALSLL